MTNELDPCPFCHGTLSVNQDEDGWWHHSCTEYCYLSAGFPTKEEAIIAANTRYKRTCKPHVVPRTFVGDTEPSFWQSLCDCGWIVGEDGTPNLSEFEHVDNFCGGCGCEVVVDGD